MRNYKYFFFLIILVLASCLSEESVPNNVIQEDRMTGLMVELHLVDGDLFNIQQTPDTIYKYSMGRYQAAFKKYRTDSVQFKKSFNWYVKHPIKLDEVCDNVIKILQAKTDSVAKIKPSKPSAPNNTPVNVPAQ
ncbi:DUF4296 domain-containing protein [Mucilaginibacter mali]|uniref:DUF4296 domain-containing protein n=1 Tax=Mucilaginibacter mali TaxID=2740462 RepID=A0A7D4ULD7_9SPHI|nr:DUF4296 domain-containing protein [Mucilaginibacter mali]QKJ29701.1 DUF4296 domain-containing protein [Mucilaginibacter mali]